LDLDVNQQVIERQIKDNLDNGEEYARITETPYQNLMFNKTSSDNKRKAYNA
jgi:hypothetical protein